MADYALKIEKFSRNKCCILCAGKEADEVSYGSIYKLGRIEVHYFCLLLSSIVVQKGEDEEGILGFLAEDIVEAGKALSEVECSYCSVKGANVRCAAARCRMVFHYTCGIKNDSFHRFSGRYPSYCSKHRSQQKIPKKIYDMLKTADIECVVCFEKVELDTKMIWAPCCKKNALFHRRCLQRLAISFGSYALKCPLCNNRKKFCDALVDNGIFIPEQDASWEADPEAFHDLLQRHNRCDAFRCVCMRGRDFSQNSFSSMWKIILCSDCGSQGIHRKCIRANIGPSLNTRWRCDVCRGTERTPSEQLATSIDSYTISSDESDVEVVDVDGASTSSSALTPAPAISTVVKLETEQHVDAVDNESEQPDDAVDNASEREVGDAPANAYIQRRTVKRSRSPSPGQSNVHDEGSVHEEKVFVCNLDERSNGVEEVEITTEGEVVIEASAVKEEPQQASPCNVQLDPILIIDSDDEEATPICIDSDDSDEDAVIEIPFEVDPDIEITVVQTGDSRNQNVITMSARNAMARSQYQCPHQTTFCAHRVPATRSRTRPTTSLR